MSEEIDLGEWLPVSPTAPFREIRAEINQQLVKLGKLDSNEDLKRFVKTLEKVCIKTVENGSMTKDLAILVGKNQKYLTTNQFLETIDYNLKKSLN